MRKVFWQMMVSLDGFMEGPNREIDWHLVDDELHSYFNQQLSAMGAFLSGRVTHELMAEFWPTADSEKWIRAIGAGFACGGALATGWLERQDGAWLQFNGHPQLNCRVSKLAEAAELNIRARGFADRGDLR